MYIRRTLEKELMKYLSKKEILAVIGPRQSGKTTLIRHIFEGLKNAVFLDFEDRDTMELFCENPNAFIELYAKKYDYLFIDEFQYARDGGKILKRIYDSQNVKVIISGSSANELSIQGIKHLVGRIFVFHLYPLSFDEFLQFKSPELSKVLKDSNLCNSPLIRKIIPYFEEFCVYGGYPRVVISEDAKEKDVVLRNIYNTYFLKEVGEILKIPSDYKLTKLIHALALQTGGILNYKELSDISGFRYKELLDFLNVLEKTFICFRCKPFFKNKRAELVKSPKIFFFDNGFRNRVISNFIPPKERVDKGALYENFVAGELLKNGIEFNYWRSKSGAEVDFVVDKDGKITPIEIKSGLVQPQTTRSFKSFLESYNPDKGYVLSEGLWADSKNIHFRPMFAVSGFMH